MNKFRSTIQKELSALKADVSKMAEKIDDIADAIEELQQYSYGFNVKLLGIPELETDETALKTSLLCSKIFREMDAEISIQDIDIAHRVNPRKQVPNRPRPIVCKFTRRLAREQIMRRRREISKVIPSNVGLPDASTLSNAMIVDHLTPKVQSLFAEAKLAKDRFNYRYCWTKKGVVYLRKSEESRAIKIKDNSALLLLAQEESE